MTSNLVQPRFQRTLGTVVTQDAARMQLDPIRNGIRVRNREIVKVITRTATTGAFPFGVDRVDFFFDNTITAQPASPGNGPMGPYLWLGQLATLYDKYRIVRLEYEFISSMPFTTTGQVGAYWDADPISLPASNFQQLSGNVYAKSTQVSQPFKLAIRPNQVDRLPQYQTSALAGSSAQDTAKTGSINLLTSDGLLSSNATGSFTLGTLWMEYEIEFINPGNPSTAQ
jgi:hypothetical protein